MYLFAFVALVILTFYLWGLAGLFFAALCLLGFVFLVWVADAQTLKKRAQQSGESVGPLHSYMAPAWKTARENFERSKAVQPPIQDDSSPAPSTLRAASTTDKASTRTLASSPGAMITASDVVGVYGFLYEKSDGRMSHRRAKILRGTFTQGAKYFGGVCLEANANRTFRVDRVVGELTHEDTGEIFDPAALYKAFERIGKTGEEENFLKGRPTQNSSNKSRWTNAVFFAGFRGGKLDDLERLANAAGWQVRGTITSTVDYVVRNGSAGQRQLDQAASLSIPVISEEDFRALL